jgi:hypothetical protein
MNGVDPVAGKYASLTPFNFSFNNPIMFNDPLGDDPPYNRVSALDQFKYRNEHGGMAERLFLDAHAGGGGMMYGVMGGYAIRSGAYGPDYYGDAVRMSHNAYVSRYGIPMGGGLEGLTNTMLYLGVVKYDGGTFTYEFGGKTYGGTYHVENGAIVSAATARVIQSGSGGWVQVGAMRVFEYKIQNYGNGGPECPSCPKGYKYMYTDKDGTSWYTPENPANGDPLMTVSIGIKPDGSIVRRDNYIHNMKEGISRTFLEAFPFLKDSEKAKAMKNISEDVLDFFLERIIRWPLPVPIPFFPPPKVDPYDPGIIKMPKVSPLTPPGG